MKCLSCKTLLKPYQRKYCSNKCQSNYQYIAYIKRWQIGLERGGNDFNISPHIKRYLLEKYNSECTICGWNKKNPTTGNVPVEVEHIDGNWKNNKEENLTLLCPNCHSLTPTFRGLNRGKGRHTNLIKNHKVTFGKTYAKLQT